MAGDDLDDDYVQDELVANSDAEDQLPDLSEADKPAAVETPGGDDLDGAQRAALKKKKRRLKERERKVKVCLSYLGVRLE